jgi:predicted TIM-barrel fold metal-dependent hydrolase
MTMQAEDIGVIDAVVNLRTSELVDRREHEFRLFSDHFGTGEDIMSVDELVATMDEVGIEKAFIIAVKRGSKHFGFEDLNVPYQAIHEVCQEYPDRFYGLAGIDPWMGMDGVRKLEEAVEEMGFIGAHLYPHWFYMEPDHRKYYPFYAKCAELGIPIQMQVGHCLIYLKDHPPMPSVGRPEYLDTIACDFPDLKLIGIHTGYPWVEEMISVAHKHPNVYIGSDAYAPKHWKPEFVEFIDSWGSDKVIFGTDYPVLEMDRALNEIDDLDIRPESKQKLLRDNAARVYDLD